MSETAPRQPMPMVSIVEPTERDTATAPRHRIQTTILVSAPALAMTENLLSVDYVVDYVEELAVISPSSWDGLKPGHKSAGFAHRKVNRSAVKAARKQNHRRGA